ncbi:hypothetical protein FO440_18250 [Mucilaginibacter corticis]|uniref:Uncharacterized protein n=1 Tax=Mucilaginibacter corticis TaxID=2597670 RepID=A0A556MID4_9SPHI|nr:hypothetical protein [Mucilaginibacter corticis]TSJ39681.1 hypothetical protein FO440_18250 [Mucilaginibacter corticis]
MKINEYEAGMLDTVLEAFGNNDKLSREQLLKIFDGDEPLAHAIVTLLLDAQLVNALEYTKEDELPGLIIREPKAILLIKNGGFTAKYMVSESTNNAQADLSKLQQENLLHQNEKMTYEKILGIMEEMIRSLELKNKRFELIKSILWLLGLVNVGLVIWIIKLIIK